VTLTYPILVLDLHQACNQNCSYCIADAGPGKSFGKCKNFRKIEPFLDKKTEWNILLTGGEPLITPNIEEILGICLDHGQVSLQTNLRAGIEKFTKVVPPDKTGWILATLHSCALDQKDRFIRNMKLLREKEYPAVAKLVLDDKMLLHYQDLCVQFDQNKIPYILSPEVTMQKPDYPGVVRWAYRQGRRILPSFPASPVTLRQYTPEESIHIQPLLTLPASHLYFKGGFESLGRSCYAGSRLFYGRLDTGKIVGCCHGYPGDCGDLYKDRILPAYGQVVCRLPHCVCDMHWYAGIVPEHDCSYRWERLLLGEA
jgi:hypothetical protein